MEEADEMIDVCNCEGVLCAYAEELYFTPKYVKAKEMADEDDRGNQMVGMVEDSWARTGGMDDRIEVYGSQGCTYGNLHMGNALPTYSNVGFGYAVEKADTTVGWTYPVFEDLWNYGFPQEMRHFAAAVRGEETLQCSGEDGRFVQNGLFASYQSMGTGSQGTHALRCARRRQADRPLVLPRRVALVPDDPGSFMPT